MVPTIMAVDCDTDSVTTCLCGMPIGFEKKEELCRLWVIPDEWRDGHMKKAKIIHRSESFVTASTAWVHQQTTVLPMYLRKKWLYAEKRSLKAAFYKCISRVPKPNVLPRRCLASNPEVNVTRPKKRWPRCGIFFAHSHPTEKPNDYEASHMSS